MEDSRSDSGSRLFGNQWEPVATGSSGSRSRRSIAGTGNRPRTTERFQPSTCPKCSAVVLHGIAEALTVDLDPTPLDATTEALAIAAGRVTWHMTTNLEVCWRTSSKIAHFPAGNHRGHAVFASHLCHDPIAPTISGWAWGPHTPAPAPEEPQF